MAKETKATDGIKKKNVNVQDDRHYVDRSGIGGDKVNENLATYYVLDSETVINSDNDTYIVLGRDRPAGPLSGYGGLGYTKSSAIDIVVGRNSNKFESENSQLLEAGLWVNPNFQTDSARIHISQKTDIDDNFDLPEGVHGKAKANSGIGMKADNVRLISREAIKLISSVSRTDSTNLNIPGSGIELIAIDPSLSRDSYNTDSIDGKSPVMQPIPKGTNLENAITELLVLFDKLAGVFAQYVIKQTEMNNYFASHTHLETFFGNQGIPSIDIQSPLCQNNMEILNSVMSGLNNFKKAHLTNYSNTYLNKLSEKYINSSYHYLN